MSPVVNTPTVVTGVEVEQAIINHLKKRLGYYAEQHGYPSPRSYVTTTNFDKWPEDQLPAVMVICPGLQDEPRKLGDGTYFANWAVGIAAFCSARTEEDTRNMSRRYGGWIRAIMVQEQSLGWSLCRGVDWVDENYDVVRGPKDRTLGSAELMFHVQVHNVVSARELPMVPDGPTPTPGPTDVQSVSVTVNPVLPPEEVHQ